MEAKTTYQIWDSLGKAGVFSGERWYRATEVEAFVEALKRLQVLEAEIAIVRTKMANPVWLNPRG